MTSLPSQFLISLCGILLLLPPGWCCQLPAFKCCAPAPMQPETNQEGSETEGECCCCSSKKSTEESKPTPTKKPTAPRLACCCEAPPVILPEKVSTDVAALDMALPLFVVDLNPSNFEGFVLHLSHPVSPPDLHLLHCVWTC